MSASHFKLDGLVALIDCNGIQADGPVVLDMEPVADKWRAFGWETSEIDGNDMAAVVGALALCARAQRQAEGDRAAHPARQGRAAHRDQREVALLPRRRGAMGRHHRRVRDKRGSRAMSGAVMEAGRTLAMGQDEAVGGGRQSVDAPFGQALARLGRERARHRRADRRPRQIHRHPAVPRRLSRPLLQRRHGRAEPRRRRRRTRPHRQGAVRHDLWRVRDAPRLSISSPSRCAHSNLNVKIIAGLPGPDDRLRRHASGDRGSGADAHDPRPHRHRSLRRDRDRGGDRGDRRHHGPGLHAAAARQGAGRVRAAATASRSARRGGCATARMSASSRPAS